MQDLLMRMDRIWSVKGSVPRAQRRQLFVNMMRWVLIIVACFVLAGPSLASEPEINRPASWSRPIQLDGVPNLHKVSDNLYRSAQPTAQGMKNLKQMGIETIVNLRSFHSDRDEIGNTGFAYEHIYMKAWHPERKEAVRFLQIVANPRRTPVLVHCLHGADRTGTMCALYRIAIQGWTKAEAIREMTEGGFNYHTVFGNLPEWIQELDVESIKKEAGISTSAEQTDPAAVPPVGNFRADSIFDPNPHQLDILKDYLLQNKLLSLQ